LPANVEIEVSILTPMRRIRNGAQVTVGKHGILLKRGLHTGLLLPQVAAGRDWTAEQFLKAVCRKALTGPEDWRHPEARLFVFEAQLLG